MMGNPYQQKRNQKSSLPLVSPSSFNRRGTLLPIPITNLDGGENSEPFAQSLAVSLRRQFPHTILIECMLERMCSIFEDSVDQQKELFKAIRKYFVQFRLLPPNEALPEMDVVRLRVLGDLNNLFRLAKSQISKRNDEGNSGSLALYSNPSPESVWSTRDASEHFFTSRYETDFQELEYIAAGGFGVVYKARNNLDHNVYAIKKIIIRPRSANKVIREVQLLSLLHHPNIVAYKSAWLEFCSPHTFHEILKCIEGGSLSSQSASSVPTKKSYSREYHESVLTHTKESNSSGSIVFESETVTESSVKYSRSSVTQPSIVVNKKGHTSSVISSLPVMLLFVQMQLCPQTLRQWLNNRNRSNGGSDPVESIDLELNVFRQILEGIGYIHASSIIHRDIKPENIFLNDEASQVQIGDFGLAKIGINIHSSSNPNTSVPSTSFPLSSATRGVGTHSYAAPEQINNEESDTKSDIYSLGIVFLELLVRFETEMERYKTIENLRNKQRLPEVVSKRWPQLAKLILKMTSADGRSRPSAKELMISLDHYQISIRSNWRIADNEKLLNPPSVADLLLLIEDLKRQLAEKDIIIEQLTRRERHLN